MMTMMICKMFVAMLEHRR